MTEPYACPTCNEFLIKSEIRLSKNGYMIPTNFFDGVISKRGEDHRCPKYTRQNQKQKPVSKPGTETTTTMQQDLHEYLRREAKLGNDNYWHLFIDGKYRGPMEKAKPEDYISWTPSQESVIKRP